MSTKGSISARNTGTPIVLSEVILFFLHRSLFRGARSLAARIWSLRGNSLDRIRGATGTPVVWLDAPRSAARPQWCSRAMTNNTSTRRIRHRVTLPLCAIVRSCISAMGFYGAARWRAYLAVYPFALQQISYHDTVNSLVYSRVICPPRRVYPARSIVRPRSLFSAPVDAYVSEEYPRTRGYISVLLASASLLSPCDSLLVRAALSTLTRRNADICPRAFAMCISNSRIYSVIVFLLLFNEPVDWILSSREIEEETS